MPIALSIGPCDRSPCKPECASVSHRHNGNRHPRNTAIELTHDHLHSIALSLHVAGGYSHHSHHVRQIAGHHHTLTLTRNCPRHAAAIGAQSGQSHELSIR